MVTVHRGISRVPGQPTFTLHPHLKLPRAPGRQIVDRGLIRSTRVDNAITGGQNTPGCCAPQIIHANERLGKLWGGTGGIPADGHKNVFHSRFPFFSITSPSFIFTWCFWLLLFSLSFYHLFLSFLFLKSFFLFLLLLSAFSLCVLWMFVFIFHYLFCTKLN